MKRLLIVEDEKMIRRGIATMVSRCSVEVEEILQCRNGIEALDILKTQKIDVMFTDIRMPKMDGIELVKEIQNLSQKPEIVVISGYDDFNYAVEMLQNGVCDYILKPVKREIIEETLEKIEAKCKKVEENEVEKKTFFTAQVKQRLLFDHDGTEFLNEKDIFGNLFHDKPYVVICAKQNAPFIEEEGILSLQNVENQTVYFVSEDKWEEFAHIRDLHYIGISLPHLSIHECKTAYGEAKKAKIKSFVTCKDQVKFENCVNHIEEEMDEDFVHRFISGFISKDVEKYKNQLFNLFFQAKHEKIDSEEWMTVLISLVNQMEKQYSHIIGKEMDFFTTVKHPLCERNLDDYQEKFKKWLEQIYQCLAEQYVMDQNMRKMEEAVLYIKNNYDKDLNMAMVSNYVSMNYSLFSLTFKEYTGINFVNYLKETRINKAKELLETTNWKISEIALKVGYENEKNFMKVFKKVQGISPTEYRNNWNIVHQSTR